MLLIYNELYLIFFFGIIIEFLVASHLNVVIMKTRIFFFIGILLLGYSSANSQGAVTTAGNIKGGTVSVLSSPELYSLATQWAAEYSRLNPTVSIQVTKVPESGISGMLKTGAGLGFVSQASDAALRGKSAWNMVVGRDVIIPVMNKKNSFLADINRKGISPAAFAGILENPGSATWGTMLGIGQNVPVHLYMVNDPAVKSGVAEFAKINPGKITAQTVESGAALAAALQNDPNAIGFCRMGTIVNTGNQTFDENIALLPIDKNGNGNLDYAEKIYDNPQAFTRGVWIGKYPKALCGNIYAVSPVQPTGDLETAFLSWVITDGQKILNQHGYNDLVYNERQTQLDRLAVAPVSAVTGSYSTYSIVKLILLVILALVVIGSIVDMIVRSGKHRIPTMPEKSASSAHTFDENSMNLPKGLFFDKTHTWAFMEKDGSVKVGIDDFLQHVTGALTRVDMRNPGEKIRKGDRLLTIVRNGKQLHLYAPVSGTIIAQNKTLATSTTALNNAPYGEGWVYTIEPTSWLRDIQFMTMAEKYHTWLKDEFTRLKEFFTEALTVHTPEYAHVVMQDGGELQDNILADLDPRVWEDFQTKFIDKSR